MPNNKCILILLYPTILCSQFLGILTDFASSLPMPTSTMAGCSVSMTLLSSRKSYTTWTFSQPEHSSTTMGWTQTHQSEPSKMYHWNIPGCLEFMHSPLSWQCRRHVWSLVRCGWGAGWGSLTAGRHSVRLLRCCILEKELASYNSQQEIKWCTASFATPGDKATEKPDVKCMNSFS